MIPSDLDPIIREALGVHTLFFRMGFTASDVYMGIQTHGICLKPHLFVILKTQGKEFNYDVGHLDLEATSVDEWQDRVCNAYTVWNKSDHPERDQIFNQCTARENTVMLISAMVSKGITPRRLDVISM